MLLTGVCRYLVIWLFVALLMFHLKRRSGSLHCRGPKLCRYLHKVMHFFLACFVLRSDTRICCSCLSLRTRQPTHVAQDLVVRGIAEATTAFCVFDAYQDIALGYGTRCFLRYFRVCGPSAANQCCAMLHDGRCMQQPQWAKRYQSWTFPLHFNSTPLSRPKNVSNLLAKDVL